MNISVPNISFRGDVVYKDRYIPHKQDNTHDIVRAHFEDQLGPYFFYLEQLAKEREMFALSKYTLPVSTKPSESPMKQSTKLKVDVPLLESLKIASFKERRKNELYSGRQLCCKPEELEALKKAGIKSIFGLVPYFEKDSVIESGIKYCDLFSLNNSRLCVFDVNGDMMKQLIKDPSSYTEDRPNSKISALKMFIKTMNGDNPDIPLPIYFGCHQGTDRTYMWYKLYNILKDEDMNKPLSSEKVQELAQFVHDADDYFRW